MMEQYTLIALALYVAVIFIISWHSKVCDAGRGFVIGGRKITAFGVGSSIAASSRDGTGVVFWITFAAMNGISPAWMIVGFFLGTQLLALLAPRVHADALAHGAVTIQDIIQQKIGKRLAAVSALLIIFVGLTTAAGNLFVIGSLMSSVTGFSKEIAIIATALVVGGYLLLGGYTTVVKTDMFQWLILAVMIIVPLFMLDWPSAGTLATQFIATDNAMKLGFFVIGLFYPLSSTDLWQRVMSTPTGATARRGVRYGSLMWPFITIGLIVLGLWLAQLMPGAQGDEMYQNIFNPASGVPTWVAVSVALIVASAVMSTIDTFISLVTTTTVSTFFKINNDSDHLRFVRISRVMIVGLMALLTFVAIQITDVVQLLLDLITIVIVGAPIYLYTVYARDGACPVRDWYLTASLLAGVGVHFWIYFDNAFASLAYMAIPVGVTALLVLLYLAACKLKCCRHRDEP